MWLTALPTLILNSKTEDREIGTRDYIGWTMWLVGMLIEAVADYQKYTFRSNPANRSVFSWSKNSVSFIQALFRERLMHSASALLQCFWLHYIVFFFHSSYHFTFTCITAVSIGIH